MILIKEKLRSKITFSSNNTKPFNFNDIIISNLKFFFPVSLNDINLYLIKCGQKHLDQFDKFPEITSTQKITNMINQLYKNKNNPYSSSKSTEEYMSNYLENLNLFNSDQKDIFNTIIKTIDKEKNLNGSKKTSNTFFVQGIGGAGKTFIYNTLHAKLRSENRLAVAIDSSAICSLLLDEGKTANSTLKIPLKCDEFTKCDIKQDSETANLIKNAEIFIWDEAPIMSK
jgi:hypothetical protein